MDITTISSKGQVVIPAHFREELGLNNGSNLVVSKIEDFLILKKMSIKDPKEEFEKLTKWGKDWSKKTGIKEKDVNKIIHKARGVKVD